ncbi:MAG: hypothetical protein KatS3mg081_2778 [Gemmatimonadales bacterium]|nr:MAG: hypothetical protein KatS3mg081_2778 [Gemmatimonadales bacterium]
MNQFAAQDLERLLGDRYAIEGFLASGGMGVIYTARHRSLGSRVAIKVLPPEVASSAVRMARFKQEAALAANLSHPHIVPVFEFDVKDNLAYLVMPFVEGETLEQRIAREKQLDYPSVREMLRQVGSALSFAHARRVIHRDIKPSNILFEKATGRWLVTDFGVARAELPGSEPITRTGIAVGTPAYMAPEQAGGKKNVDARADLYALAASAYEALAGELPETEHDVEHHVSRLQALRPDLSAKVVRELVRPLALSPDRRPESVERWLGELEKAERRRAVKPWAAAVTAVTAGVIGWIALRDAPHNPEDYPVIAVLPFSAGGPTPGIDLDSVVPEALVWQLQMLPELRVMGAAAVRRAVERRLGNEPQPLDTLLSLARDLGATLAVVGRGEVASGNVRLSVQVHETATRRLVSSADTAGRLDSLHALVSSLVVQAFARELARERSGWPGPSLPRGLAAVAAYFQGDRDFRRGAYQSAIAHFDRVIQLDSTYAPAYFKRMLAIVQLSPGEAQIRSALRAAESYADGLDPVSRQLLEGYTALVRDGDLRAAEAAFEEIVDLYPDAVDAWFALAELRFHFAPLLGRPLSEAEAAFQETARRDPWFAAPVAHLITLAMAREDDDATRSWMRRYLEIDSTSAVAELVRAADTLIFRPELAPRVLSSFPSRSREFLENVAFIAAEFGRSPLERSIGMRAIDVLWERAVGSAERERAFRMRIAAFLGSGREASAMRLVREAAARGVPREELDRWIVLSAVTAIPDLADLQTTAAAARRLAESPELSVVERWLAARWYRTQNAELAQDLAIQLRRSLQTRGEILPLEQSLLDDLAALDLLAAGDTAGALALWRRATRRFSVEQVPFSLVASLWPLRLARVRYAAASGRFYEALDASSSFVRIAAFVDQAAWPEVLRIRGEAALEVGDTALARNTFAYLLQVLASPDGSGTAARERALRTWERIKP